jgi:NAD(P)-dependent dehydrogenase (short-subunit alcohol dehydrogenase family)
MADRAAIVTGASSGIGYAIADMLGDEGFGLTVASRRPEKLDAAAEELRGKGYEVESVAGNTADEEVVKQIVSTHRDRYGRLDVLVNNAGVGIGAPIADTETKKLDIQLDVNLRAYVLFYREAVEMLRAAGAEHKNALVVNTASIAGKTGQGWLSIYSATKFGVVGFTQSMNKELGKEGIKSCALCPGFVDTPMTDFVKDQVSPDEMIQPNDIAEVVRTLLKLSPGCVVPEVVFQRPDEVL